MSEIVNVFQQEVKYQETKNFTSVAHAGVNLTSRKLDSTEHITLIS